MKKAKNYFKKAINLSVEPRLLNIADKVENWFDNKIKEEEAT